MSTTSKTRSAATRQPVTHLGQRVVGLFERTGADGSRKWELYRKVDGRPIRRTLAATTQTDAVREARQLMASLDAGTRLVSRTDITLRELRDQWGVWATGPLSDLSASTARLYIDRLDRHVLRLLGEHTRATAVTAHDLRRAIDRLRQGDSTHPPLSGSTVRCCITATSKLLAFGVRQGLLETNPVRMLERGDRPSAKRSREPRYLDRGQISALLAELNDDMRAVAATLAYAGLRVSEALALRWSDVDSEGDWLHVPGTKTAASRQPVPMVAALAAELREHRTRSTSIGFVFAGRDGQPWHRKTVLDAIYAAGDRAGLNPEGGPKVGCHSLRHSCAGLLLDAGVGPVRVAAILRHADTRTLLTTYAGLVETQREQLRGDLEAAFA